MKGRAIAVVLVLGLLASAHAKAQLREAMQAVYKIGVTQIDRQRVVGSAVLIAPGKLITSCHTTRDASSIRVLHPQGELPAQAGRSDERHDLCLLLVPELRGPVPQRVRSQELKQGTAVTAIGFQNGFHRAVHEGTITALFPFEGGSVLRTSTVFPRGASGGGLFDETGRLIGILTFRGTGGEDLNYALSVEWVEALLDESERHSASAHKALAFWEDGASDQPFFLRASWLLQGRRWTELRATASDWVLFDADNADAWFALGRAEGELGHDVQAAIALRNAVRLRSDYIEAWYWLARSYYRADHASAFIAAERQLSRLDARRAVALEADLHRIGQVPGN